MIHERERPGAGFYAAIATVVILGYVASLGPACWISSRCGHGAHVVSAIYWPMFRPFPPVYGDKSTALRAMIWYSELFAAQDWNWGPHGRLIEVIEPESFLRVVDEWSWEGPRDFRKHGGVI